MPDTTNHEFDAIVWINNRFTSPNHFTVAAAKPILHFTLMWNVFEGKLCYTQAGPKKLQQIALTLASTDFLKSSTAQGFLTFVRNRYWNNGATDDRFELLRLRTREEKDVVFNVIADRLSNARDVIYALLLVVYRYRNNAFHGIKNPAEVFGSAELFNHSSRFLALAIEYADRS